jgi:molecular chaperone GrpE
VTTSEDPANEGFEEPVIRDRRRIDPETGQVRSAATAAGAPAGGAQTPPAGGGDSPAPPPGPAPEREKELVEDLRRLKAEYVNYKRRVDRDRDLARTLGVTEVLQRMLPVLDDIDRAREHGHLDGAFKSIAESLDAAVSAFGLQRYGSVGDAFDPSIHEALMHSHDDSVDVPTCVQILFTGYRVGERILRPARVEVAEPSLEVVEESGADISEVSPGDQTDPAAGSGGQPDDGSTTP